MKHTYKIKYQPDEMRQYLLLRENAGIGIALYSFFELEDAKQMISDIKDGVLDTEGKAPSELPKIIYEETIEI